MTVTIYHNPACGTSRNVLAMIRNTGEEPHIIEYLKTPPSRDELKDLVTRMRVPLRSILRKKGTPFEALGLDNPSLTDEQLLDAIDENPILINRPIVVTPRGVKLCRPSEEVLALLDRPQQSAYVKEDGDPVVVGTPISANEMGEFAQALSAAELPTADIDLPGRQFYRFTDTVGEPVGFGGYEGEGEDRLVRSVVVRPELRGKGFGKAIASTLERIAVRTGAKRLHLLTTEAASFFEKAGFTAADRSEAPATIAGSAEFTALCPASADYLTKAVRTSW